MSPSNYLCGIFEIVFHRITIDLEVSNNGIHLSADSSVCDCSMFFRVRSLMDYSVRFFLIIYSISVKLFSIEE